MATHSFTCKQAFTPSGKASLSFGWYSFYRRQTDGRATAYSERELTFAKNDPNKIWVLSVDPPWVYPCLPNLTLIGARGGYKSPQKFKMWSKSWFCANEWRRNKPIHVKFNMEAYVIGLLSHTKLGADQCRELGAGAPSPKVIIWSDVGDCFFVSGVSNTQW